MSSIMQYNGAAVIAMAGKDCIAIASDRRYGIRNQTVGCEMQKVFQMSDKVMVGLTGLATDQQTLLPHNSSPTTFGLRTRSAQHGEESIRTLDWHCLHRRRRMVQTCPIYAVFD